MCYRVVSPPLSQNPQPCIICVEQTHAGALCGPLSPIRVRATTFLNLGHAVYLWPSTKDNPLLNLVLPLLVLLQDELVRNESDDLRKYNTHQLLITLVLRCKYLQYAVQSSRSVP
jgi:hypothetical protein